MESIKLDAVGRQGDKTVAWTKSDHTKFAIHDLQEPLAGIVCCLELVEEGMLEVLCRIDDMELSDKDSEVEKKALRKAIFTMLKYIDAAKHGGDSLKQMTS